MAVRIAINGFGRIGKSFLRALLSDSTATKTIDIVAINTGPNAHHTAHLFIHDSIMGPFPGTVEEKDNMLIINGKSIHLIAEANPENLPWKKYAIDWVIDASGCFTSKEDAMRHITAGCKKVIITAPAKNSDVTIVPGINDSAYDANKHTIISMGSCTTNCFAPIVKVLQESFGIAFGSMSTTHAYTADQRLLDGTHKDPRRARAAATNMVPTSTGASKVIATLFPELEGKLCASALRVPVPNVSLLEFVFIAQKDITVQTLNNAFTKASQTYLKNIMALETTPLVSSDFIGNTHSCIIDSALTTTVGSLGKIAAWYDNEYGYSCRLKDFLQKHGE
jgi:glyceraldehyde-3-phosphate dehydrogenase type I